MIDPSLGVAGEYLPKGGLNIYQLEAEEFYFGQVFGEGDIHEVRYPLNRRDVIRGEHAPVVKYA